MQSVRCRRDVLKLDLDDEVRLSDQSFEYSLMLLVAGIECFVCEQDDAVAQVSVEPTDEVDGLDNLHAVLSEKTAEPSPHNPFADSLLAAEHECNFPRQFRTLHGAGHPVQNVFGCFCITCAGHVLDVRSHQAPISGLRFDG